MNYAYIIFWDEGEKPIKLTPLEYEKIYQSWEKVDSIKFKGRIMSKKMIKDVKPPQKPEPLLLPEANPKPISKEAFIKLDRDIEKLKAKYNIN